MYNLEKCNSNVLEFSIPQIKRKQKRNKMCFNSMQSSSTTLYSFSFDLTWLSFVQCQNAIYCIQIKNELLWKLQIYYRISMYHTNDKMSDNVLQYIRLCDNLFWHWNCFWWIDIGYWHIWPHIHQCITKENLEWQWYQKSTR